MREVNSLFGALLLLLSCGMHMGWSLLNTNTWQQTDGNILVLLSTISFFIGSVFGTIFTNIAFTELSTKQIQLNAAIFVGVASIMCMIPQDDYQLLTIFNKLLAGLGHGTISFSYLKQSSEIAPHHRRGWFISLGPLALFIGVFIYYGLEMVAVDRSDLYIGVLSGLDAILAGIFILNLTADSPLYVLQNEDEDACRQSIKALRTDDSPLQDDERVALESTVTAEVEVLKDFIGTRSLRSERQWKDWFWLIVMFKIVAVSSFNYFMNQVISVGFRDNNRYWGMALFPVARIGSHLMGAAIIDTFGRFSLCLIWCISSCYCFLCVGVSLIFDRYSIQLADVIMLQLHLLSAFGYSIPDIFAAEWFPIHVRQKMIARANIVEPIFHIITICFVFLLRNPIDSPYIYSTAFVFCAFCLLMACVTVTSITETRNLSLADVARGKITRIETKHIY